MAHIEFAEGLPRIRGSLALSPATTKPLCDLVEVLRYGPHTLTPAEREMIATYVSSQNDCYYCQSCHGSTAAQHLGGNPADYKLIDQIKQDYEAAPVSEKMKALLAVAGKVQKGGKHVTTTRFLSRPHSACSIATWTAWPRGSRVIQIFTVKLESRPPAWVMRAATGRSRWQRRQPSNLHLRNVSTARHLWNSDINTQSRSMQGRPARSPYSAPAYRGLSGTSS